MKDKLIHVYLMPGMAANPSIFKNLQLDATIFKIHLLSWFVPDNDMSLSEYAKKMSNQVLEENPVLIGVSFGGMLVQEMSKYINAKKIIIISSVKKITELPKRMLFAKYTKVHKLLPTGLVSNIELLAKYAFGETATKRVALYEEFLSVRDKRYIDWAIDQIVNWSPSTEIKDLVHIHGEKDPVFPIKNIKDCIVVGGGTHTMIIHRAKWFNEQLSAIILD